MVLQQLSAHAAFQMVKFDFFKGLNDPPVAGGTLSADIPAGTVSVLLLVLINTNLLSCPLQKQGIQDDCIRINVKNSI